MTNPLLRAATSTLLLACTCFAAPASAATLTVQTFEFVRPLAVVSQIEERVIEALQTEFLSTFPRENYTDAEYAIIQATLDTEIENIRASYAPARASAEETTRLFHRGAAPLTSYIPESVGLPRMAAEARAAELGAPLPVGGVGTGQTTLTALGVTSGAEGGEIFADVTVTTRIAATVVLDIAARQPGTEAFVSFTNFEPETIDFIITPFVIASDGDPILPFVTAFDPFVFDEDVEPVTVTTVMTPDSTFEIVTGTHPLAQNGSVTFEIGAALDALLATQGDALLNPSGQPLSAGFRVECLRCMGMNAFGATFEERLLAPGEDTAAYQTVSRFLNDEVLSALANAPPNPQPVPLPAMGAPFALLVLGGLAAAALRRRGRVTPAPAPRPRA